MLNRIFIILICLSCFSCHAQVDKSLIDNWKSYAIPTNQDTLRKYNYSQNEWSVFIKDNKVHVTKNRLYHDPSIVPFKINSDEKDRLSILKVEDGYLIGFYRGEWGGHLDYFSKNGKDHYLISGDEIVQFIKKDSKIFAIQGLAHMGMSEGSIIKITKENGKWTSKEYLKLPTAPDAIGLDRNKNFIVITSKSLLKVDSNAKINVLIEQGIWYARLYTNSIVIKDDIVYAGMRAGVYKYNLQTGRQEWLLPY